MKDKSPSDISALAKRLMSLGYARLFQGSDESTINALWKEPGMTDALALLSLDSDSPMLARFLAAEVILYYEKERFTSNEKKQLALVYATALAQGFTESANPWGLPGFFGGLLEEHVVFLGEVAIPDFVNLMENEKRIYYIGSKESTVGNGGRYRVKDLAAYYISAIKNSPLELDEEPVKRNEQIEKLKNSIV